MLETIPKMSDDECPAKSAHLIGKLYFWYCEVSQEKHALEAEVEELKKYGPRPKVWIKQCETLASVEHWAVFYEHLGLYQCSSWELCYKWARKNGFEVVNETTKEVIE